ncbi:transposase [Methanosarcina sp.]|uniref:transposase n=1 Tax=Methanosarcina sp. TaxID=2213 RepID=UPI003A101EAF
MHSHFPPQPKVGRKRINDRQTINGILYVLVTGCQWRDMPKQYGSYGTAWRRLKRWSEEGVWM